MAPGRAILQGDRRQTCKLVFSSLRPSVHQKSNSKRASQYTLPPARQSTDGRKTRKTTPRASFDFAPIFSELPASEKLCWCSSTSLHGGVARPTVQGCAGSYLLRLLFALGLQRLEDLLGGCRQRRDAHAHCVVD